MRFFTVHLLCLIGLLGSVFLLAPIADAHHEFSALCCEDTVSLDMQDEEGGTPHDHEPHTQGCKTCHHHVFLMSTDLPSVTQRPKSNLKPGKADSLHKDAARKLYRPPRT